jgi:RNA polymerase sigma-70 factor (ECF subfamily)
MSEGLAITTANEAGLLDAARKGDEEAFGRLVEQYRKELQAHCYRMLASVQDAEDALQETLLRAWRGLSQFEGKSSVRAWLYRIATNTCINFRARGPRRMLPIEYGPSARPHVPPGQPLLESVWVEPYPDEWLGSGHGFMTPEAHYERRESVELAFIAALQHLSARQRAALILRDVLGFSARESAQLLDASATSVHSALQRARKTIAERLPKHSQQATLRSLGDARQRQIVQSYVDAWERDDVNAIVAMLSKDATWSMPPMTTWYRGLRAITGFLNEHPGRDRWRRLPTRANGQLAVAGYKLDTKTNSYVPWAIDVFTLKGTRIQTVTAFVMPEVFARFGLPAEIPA